MARPGTFPTRGLCLKEAWGRVPETPSLLVSRQAWWAVRVLLRRERVVGTDWVLQAFPKVHTGLALPQQLTVE